MTRYIVIVDQSAGNESVGEMWQETKIFDDTTTLFDVMKWAEKGSKDYPPESPSHKKITITRPDEA